MQAAALLALLCRTDDEFSDLRQVAQLQQVIGNGEVTVILLDFLLQQGHPPGGPLQAFVGAHNPHVVPHATA